MTRRRLRPPEWVKRLLLPIWNGSHRLARRARAIVGAVAAGRIERCDCCGRQTLMLSRPHVIPAKLVEVWGLNPRQTAALIRKESLDCLGCGAKLRARRLARVVLELYPVGRPPCPARSLADWARTVEAKRFRVAELNRIDGLHESLAGLPGLRSSDFQEGVKPGLYVSDVRNEDLSALTYADRTFDLLLTSETLEHVPDLAKALGEIRRVLVPGGRHVFTVPLLSTVPKTFPRAEIGPDGTLRAVAPPIRHPGGDVGYPVVTEFGADFPEILRNAGFTVEIRFGPTTDDDLAQVYVTQVPCSSSSKSLAQVAP